MQTLKNKIIMETLKEINKLESLEDRIERLAKEIEKVYNERHFWKRGHIYADGFRNGAKTLMRIIKDYQ